MNRRELAARLPAGMMMLNAAITQSQPAHAGQRVLIGTSGRGGRGIYLAHFSEGELSEPVLLAEAAKASFLARPAERPDLLFAVNQPQDAPSEALSFRIHEDAKLTPVGHAASHTTGGVYVAAARNARCVVIANYGGASVASFLVDGDGRLSLASHIDFSADSHGPDPDRQRQSFPHSAVFSPDGGYVLVNDLGLDCIHVFRLDHKTAKLTPNDPPCWKARPGSGPRHLALHPNGRWIYSVNELDSTIDQLDWNAADGVLTLKSSVQTLPAGISAHGKRACEVVFSKDLRFLYASNRVWESFTVFAVDARTGALSLVQHLPNPGKESRHMAMDATGGFLLSANQFSDEISVFPIHTASGRLEERSQSTALGGPSCLLFL